ncbi:hypothetical protein [Thiocapsa imhoffii]|uniref:hypothetical protein n=1 Tax=Thiocapsa imhoffii TaxID=382777 RepID=UPI0019071272|nr:hypothetical protein [Thiocapsa imhoffii]
MPHLLLAVTAHGFGHLAQVAPVIDELIRRWPRLRLTLQSDIDPDLARRILPAPFQHLPEATDVGLLMDGPLRTCWADSVKHYAAFEADYDQHLEREISLLRAAAPDLVLADVPWLPLDAAHRLGIPAVALCSLNWFDILRLGPVADQVPATVMERMRTVYAGADLFIRPAPSMPMEWLPNARDVGPIARRYPDLRAALRARRGIPNERPLVLVQFGGFAGFDPLRDWPEQDEVHYLVQERPARRRRDATSLSALGLIVPQVIGSCDLMICKPGYGTFAEAAVNRTSVLYVKRGDWPEEPALVTWLTARMPAREIALDALLAGRLSDAIADVLGATQPPAQAPTGAAEVADLLSPWLGSASMDRGAGQGGPDAPPLLPVDTAR